MKKYLLALTAAVGAAEANGWRNHKQMLPDGSH
jgi:hypothetical protein